jgi:ubiquinone/menaquinone biosynthesis C-methylase UbiE
MAVGVVKGLDVLDLACGDGRFSRRLIKHGTRSVIGTDVSEEMIRRALKINEEERLT